MDEKIKKQMKSLLDGFIRRDPTICNVKECENGFTFEARDLSILVNKGRELYSLLVINNEICTVVDGGIRNSWPIQG